MIQPRFIAPTKDYSGYIFDCDGTLVDTMKLHHRAWCSALSQAGATFEFSWEVFIKRAGMTLERTVSELNLEFNVAFDPLHVASAQREYYDLLVSETEPVVPVVEFARELRARGKKLAVASGSQKRAVLAALEQVKVRDWFEVIITPEDVSHGKPSPESFLLAAERIGVSPAECLVIEDGEMGFEAARRAGMDYAVVLPEAPSSREVLTSL
jgi:HAD superfamily hydrolase (TIGR01509 family)